jgi:hypothetical protein
MGGVKRNPQQARTLDFDFKRLKASQAKNKNEEPRREEFYYYA